MLWWIGAAFAAPIHKKDMHEQANHFIGLTSSKTEKIPVYRIGRLWELAASLPTRMVPLENLAAYLDEHPAEWWSGPTPTVREVAERARRIQQADLTRPIILSAEGFVLDGQHRIAKAWMLGCDVIAAVQFATNPEPDAWLDRADPKAAPGIHP